MSTRSNKAQQIEQRRPGDLKPYARNARTHSKKQVRQIADSIERFGFTNPVLISDDEEIIAGHGRVQAAKLLGLDVVPTLRLSHLNEAERRAYVLADNKLALNAGWDQDILGHCQTKSGRRHRLGIGCRHDQASQPISLLQLVAGDHSPGRDDVREIPAVAAQR